MKKSHDFYLIPVSILFFLGKNVSRMRKTRYPWYCIDYFNKFNFALIRKCLFFLLGKIGLQNYLKKKSLRLGQIEKLGTLIRFFKSLNFKGGEGNSSLRVETYWRYFVLTIKIVKVVRVKLIRAAFWRESVFTSQIWLFRNQRDLLWADLWSALKTPSLTNRIQTQHRQHY